MTTNLAEGHLAIEVDGRLVDIDITDFDRGEWRLIRTELRDVLGSGVPSQIDCIQAFARLDLDVISAAVWVVLRRDDPAVAFGDVNLKLGDVLNARDKEAAAGPPG